MNLLIRVVKTSFKTSKANLQRLFDTNRISAQVWNDTLKIAKEYALQNNGKWINKVELQTALKNKYPIHSQSIQAVAHKYLFARKATLEKLEKGLKARYPYKQRSTSILNGYKKPSKYILMVKLNLVWVVNVNLLCICKTPASFYNKRNRTYLR